MEQVIQEIVAIDIVNVAIVSVSPVFRPRIDEHKGIATIFKAQLTVHNHRTLRPERMASPKLCAKPIIGDAATPAGRPRVFLLLASFLPTRFLATRFLPARFWPARFWLRRPCLLPRRLFPLSLFLRMFLLVRSCRLWLILARGPYFLFPGIGAWLPDSAPVAAWVLPVGACFPEVFHPVRKGPRNSRSKSQGFQNSQV